MAVAPVYGTSAVRTAEIKTAGDTAAEQKDMFLKLMIAQLKNQDPSSPMDQKDMMAGITQMSQVEQMMNMTKSMESLALSQGVGMVGKVVQYTSVVKNAQGEVLRNQTMAGTVDHIVQKDGSVKLVVNVIGSVKSDGSISEYPPGSTETIGAGSITRVG